MDLMIEEMVEVVNAFEEKLLNNNLSVSEVKLETNAVLNKVDIVRKKVIQILEIVDYVNVELEQTKERIARAYSKHKVSLQMMKDTLVNYMNYSSALGKEVLPLVVNLKLDEAESLVKKHQKEKVTVESNLLFNIKSYLLINEYDINLRKMFKEYFSQKDHTIYEINRHEVLGKDKKVFNINKAFSKAENEFHKYESMIRNKFSKESPADVATQLDITVNEFKKYIDVVKENTNDVNQIIKSTDEINKDISLANVYLLQAEQFQMDLPEIIRPRYKEKTLNLHIKLDETIIRYRSNVDEITKEQKSNVQRIVAEIEEFKNEMNTQSFLYTYSK